MGIKKKNKIEMPFEELMRKWTIIIIKDMFIGAKRFNDFLEMNSHISGKVLSDQLKRLESNGYIEKRVVSTTPLRAEYHLTQKGRDLNKILYEMVIYGYKYWYKDVDCEPLKKENLKKTFDI